MSYRLEFTADAEEQLYELEQRDPKKHRKVRKTLGLLERDPKYPGLNSHKYQSVGHLLGVSAKVNVFESYVENNTPAAYRIFWTYGPRNGVITVLAIVPHP